MRDGVRWMGIRTSMSMRRRGIIAAAMSMTAAISLAAAVAFMGAAAPVFAGTGKTSDAPIAPHTDVTKGYYIDRQGDLVSIEKPSQVYLPDISSVSTGQFACLAVARDGQLWGWGPGAFGLLGKVSAEADTTQRPVPVMRDVQMASVGVFHCVALKKDGSVWTWGLSNDGAVENPVDTTKISYEPVKIMEDAVFARADGYASLAIGRDGVLYGWGDRMNIRGAAGPVSWNEPVRIAGNVRSACFTGYELFMILTDNSLWRIPQDGKSGPEKVMEGVRFCDYGLIVQTDGSLWLWGENHGRIGDGTTEDKTVPVKLMDGVAYAINNYDITGVCIVTKTGELWITGFDPYSPYSEEKEMSLYPRKLLDGVAVIAETAEPTEPVTPYLPEGSSLSQGEQPDPPGMGAPESPGTGPVQGAGSVSESGTGLETGQETHGSGGGGADDEAAWLAMALVFAGAVVLLRIQYGRKG